MRFNTLFATISGLAVAYAQVGTINGPVIPGTTGALGDAAITTRNPPGVTYQAILPNRNTTNIRGYVAGTSNTNGTGVVFNINIFGLPNPSLGPFSLSSSHTHPVFVLVGEASS